MEKNRGYSIAEILLALVIAAAAFILLSKSFVNVDKQSRRDRLASTMAAVENSLVAAISQSEHLLRSSQTDANCGPGILNYPLCLRQKLEFYKTSGGAVPDLEIFDVSSPNLLIAKISQPAQYDTDGNPCSGHRCEVSSQIFLERHLGSLWIAYRVSQNTMSSKDSAGTLMALGLPLGMNSSDPSYFSYFRPFPSKLHTLPSSGVAKCSTFVKGVDPLTGEVICWEDHLTPTACPVGTFMVGYKSIGSQLSPNCVTFKSMKCEPGYALSSFKPSTLFDMASVENPTCVFARPSSVPYSVALGTCPKDYSPHSLSGDPTSKKVGPWQCRINPLTYPLTKSGITCVGACL